MSTDKKTRESIKYLTEKFGLRIDNPSEKWMLSKQQEAERLDTHYQSYVRGSTTAFFSKPMRLPAAFLQRLKGSMGEERYRQNSTKYQNLMEAVKEHGWDDTFTTSVVINHKGEPYITEGNHRIQVAYDIGKPDVSVEIKYANGGECVANGQLSLDALAKILRAMDSQQYKCVDRDLGAAY